MGYINIRYYVILVLINSDINRFMLSIFMAILHLGYKFGILGHITYGFIYFGLYFYMALYNVGHLKYGYK